MRRIGYEKQLESVDYDLILEWTDSTQSLGLLQWPRINPSPFILKLSNHIVNEPEEDIKDVIYHELIHYIDGQDAIESGIVWWDFARKAYMHKRGTNKPHGDSFKRLMRDVNSKLGTNITITGDINRYPDIDKKGMERKRYVVRCNSCGLELKYERESKFVRNPNMKSPYSDRYYWTCGRCGKSGEWETIKLW